MISNAKPGEQVFRKKINEEGQSYCYLVTFVRYLDNDTTTKTQCIINDPELQNAPTVVYTRQLFRKEA